MVHEGAVIVPATADVVTADKTQWVAKAAVPQGQPLAGLFGFGDTFPAARKALAEVVWAAVKGGAAGIDPAEVKAVRIFATTRKSFPVAELDAA